MDKKTLIILAVITLIILSGVWYFYNQNTGIASNTNQPSERVDTGKLVTYESKDKRFKIDYLDNWKILTDNDLYFDVETYGDSQMPEAMVRIKKIEATNKNELQDYFNKEGLAINVADLKMIKVSGIISRIDSEDKYLSGTTIYIYVEDYYLAVYLDYQDEYLPVIERMIDSIYIDIESPFKHYYCNREPGQVSSMWGYDAYCYTVESGDTLWTIAETYYGDPYLWSQLRLYDDEKEYDITPESPDDARFLLPGTKLILWQGIQVSFDQRTAGGISDGWGIDLDTGDLYTTGSQKIYVNNEIYDEGFAWVSRFLIDERTNNKVYITKPEGVEKSAKVFQFVFNKERNPYMGEGFEFELLTFNHNEDKYVVRTNVKQDVPDPGFMALSNIGNGPEYDYLDSFIWYDNNTLVYRAQNDDQWRIVINHEDYKIYSYLENLRLEEDIIKFDVRDEEGKWTQEEIFIDDDSYNAEIVSIPDTPPVGEGFMDYLRNTRSDLSEAEIFKIEKNYHYKTGTLVDEFGNLVEDPVELYLEPVANMGMSEDIGRLTFTAKNGRFELFVYDIGPYILSLPDGWSAQELEKINPVDFRYSSIDYKMTVHNKEYDKKAKAKYIQIAEKGDTLWSMADEYYGQGYFWPLVAENSDIDYADGIPEIAEGDELYFLPFEDFSIDKLEELRRDFHEKNIEEILTINNNDFAYSIDYPSCWKIGNSENLEYNENSPRYKNYIHKQSIKGPIYRVGGRSGQYHKDSFVNISVYDNRNNMDFTEFIIDKGYTDSMVIDSVMNSGNSIFEEWDNGGILMINGYYNDTQHLLFFKDNLVYDISFAPLYKVKVVDQILYQEIVDIIHSFKFIDLE